VRWPTRGEQRERGRPSSTTTPAANETPTSRERFNTPVMPAIAVEPCAACSCPPARKHRLADAVVRARAAAAPRSPALSRRGRDRDQACLHRRVGQHSLDVGVTVQHRGGDQQRRQPDHQQPGGRIPSGATSMIGLIRISTEKATDSRTPLISAETGAWCLTVGRRPARCERGNRPALAP